MRRWLVELLGEKFDVEEFPHWFPTGDIHAITEGETVFLTGPDFEQCADAEAVRRLADRVVEEQYAIVCLLQAGVKLPQIGRICREREDGTRNAYVLLAGAGHMRMKLRGMLTSGAGDPPGPTQAQEFLSVARSNRHLLVAVSLLARPSASWPHLYRCLEELEHYLGKTVFTDGLSSNNQRERFTRSANAAEIAGTDARHRLGKFEPPSNPMSLVDARAYIVGMLQVVLRRANPKKHVEDAA